jgi:hypothetical protein
MKRGSFLLIVLLGNSNFAMERNPGKFAYAQDVQAARTINTCEEISLDEVVIIKGIDGEWRYAQVTHLPSVQTNWHGMLSFDPEAGQYRNFVANFKKVKKLSEEQIDSLEEGFLKFLEKITI